MWRAVLIGIAIGIGGCSDGGNQSQVSTAARPTRGSSVVTDGGTVDPGGRTFKPAFDIFDDTRVHELALTMSPKTGSQSSTTARGDEWRHATHHLRRRRHR